MKIVVVSITYRTLNNIASVLQALVARGVQCEVIWAPISQRVEGQSPRNFGLNVGLEFAGSAISGAEMEAVFSAEARRFLDEFQPDLVLSDDMTAWPNRCVFEQVCKIPGRPWHLAWQHGLFQPWYEMQRHFDADIFFCYGRIHAFLLGEQHASRVLPVGLPKLDSLAVVDSRQNGGYLSWFAQLAPDARVQVDFLTEIAKSMRLPVRLRPHPAAPFVFDCFNDLESRGLQIDDPAIDPINSLRCCNGFLTTHSSATIEALLLGKSAVLFPSFGLTSLPGYPNVASDFTARSYVKALGNIDARRDATEAFLVDCIGGRRFDHTERSLRVIDAVANLRREGVLLERIKLQELGV